MSFHILPRLHVLTNPIQLTAKMVVNMMAKMVVKMMAKMVARNIIIAIQAQIAQINRCAVPKIL
jgi:hypothetical protein